MKLNSLISALALCGCIGTSAFGQNINFRIEQSFVTTDGVTFPTASTVGFTLQSATMDLADFNDLSFSTSSSVLATEIQALFAGVSPLIDDAWASVPAATGPIASTGNEWNLQRTGLTVTKVPVLLISSAPIASLSVGDYVGLVASSTEVPAGGTNTVTFGGSPVWDTVKLGTLNPASFQMVAVVPEPSVYAALLGLGALGFVMWRRRRN